MTGLVKVTHDHTSEWVHPSVADLYRRQGPALFDKGSLAAADAAALKEAREKVKDLDGLRRGGTHGDAQNKPSGKDVLSTLRLLGDQVMAMMEEGGASGAG